ncbi:PTS hybrid protein [Saccharopolyspora lacisalsi]|uniref:Phosphocarrier protein HPr n=1 Tax=Halosaccharopolyspora lacisalsi TaxID=1000566 RepID=A0A839DYC0_9PSEU|nr:dihydroxyacetone kinase phosphoryl donor subunit DhaM [Halosaccharopolyspora lacisalsi]MBA8825216.1 PTS hybrid protein [Halosaccharopolyspora lacisalsi]
MSVGLVLVSHSRRLAEGVAELAEQMAPGVRIVPTGGTADGGTGTDFESVSAALEEAETGSGVVLVYDLGSAHMTAELAVEALDDPSGAVVADGPLVEGAVAAAVAAQGDRDKDAVARAAADAVGTDTRQAATSDPESQQPGVVREEIVLDNEVGLHARPAALLSRSLTGMQARVTVALGDKEADASSVLGVMGLGAQKGDRIALRATGPDAVQAVQRITELADNNFDA